MTDNEIIKALECCTNGNGIGSCVICPLANYSFEECGDILLKASRGLINRQKAEIERLQKVLDLAENCIDEVEDALYRGEKNYYAECAVEKYKEMTEE